MVAWLQLLHVSVQALSQQKPSAQNPDTQSAGVSQNMPVASLSRQARPPGHCWVARQATAQHVPLTQLVEVHSRVSVHDSPFGRRARHRPPRQYAVVAHSLSDAHELAQVSPRHR
jgi:hypothetical protein